MYVNFSVGRMLLSRAIGSVFFIATAVIICIIKENFNDRRQEKMGSHFLPVGGIRGKCKFANQRGECCYGRNSETND